MKPHETPQDGGPAFPGGVAGEEYGDHQGEPMNDGMLLRDYFAAKALCNLNFTYNEDGLCEPTKRGLLGMARAAYQIADAMLEARNSEVTP